MIEEQPKRRQRNPLSAEELHYFIKLKQLGCDYFQGYYFNRPLTADKLIDELTATHS